MHAWNSPSKNSLPFRAVRSCPSLLSALQPFAREQPHRSVGQGGEDSVWAERQRPGSRGGVGPELVALAPFLTGGRVQADKMPALVRHDQEVLEQNRPAHDVRLPFVAPA